MAHCIVARYGKKSDTYLLYLSFQKYNFFEQNYKNNNIEEKKNSHGKNKTIVKRWVL